MVGRARPTSSGSAELTAGLRAAAGFTAVRVRTADVPTGLVTPAELASWRLGLAQVAPFLRALDAPARTEVRRAAEQAVAAAMTTHAPMVVSMVILTAR